MSSRQPSTLHVALHVAIDQHFDRCGGACYTDLSYDYEYWREYLAVVDEVRPVARLRDAREVEASWRRADGAGVRFAPVTSYHGLWSYLRSAPRVLRDCHRIVREGDVFLLRWGLVAVSLWLWLLIYRKPYGFECVSNARDGMTGNRQLAASRLERPVTWLADWLCRRMARGAACNAYVSRYVQSLYPGQRRDREWVFSSVQLVDALVTGPRARESFRTRDPHIVSVGRLEPEKGHAVLIHAVAELVKRSPGVRVTLVGPGGELERLRALVSELGLAANVRLPGPVKWGPALWTILDDADLFVLPSLTEGMPRAMIEAMARGLPCIGSAAGGISELLAPGDLVPPGDVGALARSMAAALGDGDRLAAMSAQSFERACEFSIAVMTERKHAFWRCLLEQAR